MKNTVRVLCIGLEESMRAMYCALFGRREYELITATTYRELCGISAHETFQIAVLNHTLSREENVAAAQLIRRQWPLAKILVVSAQTPRIDDALYDDRVGPGVPPDLLFAAIVGLTKGQVKAAD
jgi:hypothetical protein